MTVAARAPHRPVLPNAPDSGSLLGPQPDGGHEIPVAMSTYGYQCLLGINVVKRLAGDQAPRCP